MLGSNRNQSKGRSEPDSARQYRVPTASGQTRARGEITLKFEHYKMAGSGGGLVGMDRGGDEGGRASCFLCVGIMIQEDGGSGRRRGGQLSSFALESFRRLGWLLDNLLLVLFLWHISMSYGEQHMPPTRSNPARLGSLGSRDGAGVLKAM